MRIMIALVAIIIFRVQQHKLPPYFHLDKLLLIILVELSLWYIDT